MYGAGRHKGEAAVQISMQKFAELKDTYQSAKTFFVYFEKTWIPKLRMWVKGYRTVPHANQDTNAAVESYHNNLKSILRITRGGLEGRRIDWLIYHLAKDILTHYWYAVQCKLYGFIKNGKAEGMVASAVLRARDIPDAHVVFDEDHQIAYVASQNHLPSIYAVKSPHSDWASCDCPLGKMGTSVNI